MQTPAWQQALNGAFHDLPSLLDHLGLDMRSLPLADAAARHFSLRVPRGFADLMRHGDPHDPLLRQVLPLADELATAPGFDTDPVGDREALAVPGLLHKYRGRVLIVATGACAVHCRYCFRRHYPYHEGSATKAQWNAIIDYLKAHPEVDEVILSGGDPLMANDRKLAGWLDRLEALQQIARLRIHTRLPVVLPQRITPELVDSLKGRQFESVVVIHANHPQELSAAVAEGLAPLRSAGITLLNQSVLLQGVNDDTRTLVELSERLFRIGVLPYYLHMLDRVSGAAHFEVAESRALSIHRALRLRLPGYLVPKLVREIPGESSKTPLV